MASYPLLFMHPESADLHCTDLVSVASASGLIFWLSLTGRNMCTWSCMTGKPLEQRLDCYKVMVFGLVCLTAPSCEDKLFALCNCVLSICVHLKVAEDIGQGLLALHERGIVHRDLKPHNALLTGQQRAKVSDMGHCKRLLDQQASFESPGAGMEKAKHFPQTFFNDVSCQLSIQVQDRVLGALFTGRCSNTVKGSAWL